MDLCFAIGTDTGDRGKFISKCASSSLTSSYSSYAHMGTTLRFFCGIPISSALNRFVQLDAPFAIILLFPWPLPPRSLTD